MKRLFDSREFRKFRRSRTALAALAVIIAYSTVALAVRAGALERLGASYDEPIVHESQEIARYTEPSRESWQHWFGTDRQGRSILVRTVASIDVAMSVGLITALIAVGIGTLLGSIAGYYGGRADDLVVWLYSTLSSIPYLLLLLVLSYSAAHVFGKGIAAVYIAFGATFWVGPCRVIRAEVLKIRELDYIQAAIALGAPRARILIRHVIPNVAHLSFVYFALVFIGAIKSEVILSFLGLGVQNQPSWGVMIDQARAELAVDFYWQIGAATAFMFVLVLAFNVFTDTLQDVLDPKNV